MAQTVQRAAEHGAVPNVQEARDRDTAFYRLVTLVAAALIGVALAVLWNHQVVDPIAMAIQREVVGTTTPAEVATALALAFVAGASMVVTA